MNELQHKSLDANLDRFCKDLSDSELSELTDFLVYGCYSEEPKEWVKDFIDDFIGNKEWAQNLADEKNPPQYFFKATRNTQEIVRLVRIGLLEKSFHRFSALTRNPLVSLTKSDKKNLKEILHEHKTMLEYQLEDEDFIRNSVGYVGYDEGEELVDEKKRHLKFLETFGLSK
jgi:DNA-binding MarR family transcriptional regulator